MVVNLLFTLFGFENLRFSIKRIKANALESMSKKLFVESVKSCLIVELIVLRCLYPLSIQQNNGSTIPTHAANIAIFLLMHYLPS
jgi:hypothetical protein